ncbi:hypothetical protein D3C72_2132580 [compost metagenome]
MNDPTCKITDSVSTTNTPPIINSKNSWRSSTAMVPNAPPSANEPTSPMKTWAG